MPHEGSTRAGILPGCPSLDRESREARGRVRTTDLPVWEVTRHLLNLYDLWRRFDEANEMPNLLLKKIPRPVVQPPHNPQSSSFPNSSNVQPNAITGGGSGASQSSASLSGGGGQGQQPPPPPGHTAAQLLAATTVGGAGSSGGGSNIITEAQPPLHHHNQPTRTAPGGGQVKKNSFSCSAFLLPNCLATRREQEGWNSTRLPKPRQGKLRGKGRGSNVDL
ncbi:hypothetical protein T265_13303, partial [Opisthorchis viverrini]